MNTNTKIYKYHQLHPEIIALAKIINDNIINLSALLYNCYNEILENKLDEIIYDIVGNPVSMDEVAICKVAVANNRLDIIDFMIAKKSTHIHFNSALGSHTFEILQHVVQSNNMIVVKYLVDNGISPFEHQMNAFKSSFYYSIEIFNYYINLDIPYTTLCSAFLWCCFDNYNNSCSEKKLDMIKQILNIGININDISTDIIKNSGRLKVNVLQFLMDHGFDISNTKILLDACRHSNHELIEFLLKQGIEPDNRVLNAIFKSFNIDIVKLLIKYNIDLSNLKPIVEHVNIANQLESLGMDNKVLISFLLEDLANQD